MIAEISFIVPAYNEESHIENLIKSIQNSVKGLQYEIIIVDNGSTDNTLEIARKNGARVVSIKRSTISIARNVGTLKANAEVVAFLDADVRITKEWGKEILERINNIQSARVLTGSRYLVPENPSWIEKNWFQPLSLKDVTYINGGNIVVSKKTFALIGGFNEMMVSGEDYEFSMRAISKGIAIENNPAFKAIHDGYPGNITDFCKREYWHGKGDCQSFHLFIHSKVSIAAVIFGLLHLGLIVSMLSGSHMVSFVLFTAILSICMFMSISIFAGSGMKLVFQNVLLCYLYLVSRFFSFLSVLIARK